jgi:hypothetical protein
MHTRFNAVCPVTKVASILIHTAFICLESYPNRQALHLEHCTSPDPIILNKNISVFKWKIRVFSFVFEFYSFVFCFWKFALLCFVFLVLAHIRIHSEVPTQPSRPELVAPRTHPWTYRDSSRKARHDTLGFAPTWCRPQSSNEDAWWPDAFCVRHPPYLLSSHQTRDRNLRKAFLNLAERSTTHRIYVDVN